MCRVCHTGYCDTCSDYRSVQIQNIVSLKRKILLRLRANYSLDLKVATYDTDRKQKQTEISPFFGVQVFKLPSFFFCHQSKQCKSVHQ